MKTARDIAADLSRAVEEGTDMSVVMVGAAAFIAAIIYRNYKEGMREQIVITHANTVLEMLDRVETQEVQEAAQQDAEEEEEEEGEKKEWMQ